MTLLTSSVVFLVFLLLVVNLRSWRMRLHCTGVYSDLKVDFAISSTFSIFHLHLPLRVHYYFVSSKYTMTFPARSAQYSVRHPPPLSVPSHNLLLFVV